MGFYEKEQTLTCPECGTEFQATNRRAKYCKPECRLTRNRRNYKKKYGKRERLANSTMETVVCAACDDEFTYRLFPNSKPRIYCSQKCYHSVKGEGATSPRAKPLGELNGADLAVIQLIWDAFDYHALAIFPKTRNVVELYERLISKEMFHEWVVFSIIFQSHLLYRYEMIVQIPGLVKADFLRLCQKYRIILQDSEQFAEDMNANQEKDAQILSEK